MPKTKIISLKRVLVGASVMALSVPAFAEGTAFDKYIAAVNFTSVSLAITGIGVLIVGMAMALKGISLAKRVISKA